jgi:dihydrofolate synthase/folylpolyglutamate synthase
VKDVVDELIEEKKIVHPAFFEFVFLMAVSYFADEGCDYVVYETGLGGRLDATNVIVPEISIITSIGLDHMQYLGDTIQEIAGEKAGIIKPGVPVIYNTGEDEADEVIGERAKELGTESYNVVEYIDTIRKCVDSEVLKIIDSETATYQKDNIYTAITAISVISSEHYKKTVLDSLGILYKDESVKTALSDFYWPGRMEYIADNILIDGAHNVDAIARFVESVKGIQERDGWKKLSLLFAVSNDKDYRDIIEILTENLSFEDIYVGEIASDRRTDAGEVVKLFQERVSAEKHFSVVGNRSLKKAWEYATGELDNDTLLLVVGSLYMVGEIKSLLEKN